MTRLLRPLPRSRRAASAWLLSGIALVLGLAAADVRAQGEAEALSASFRKASRRVLPAVVTVRAVGADADDADAVPFGPPGLGRRFRPPFPGDAPFGPGFGPGQGPGPGRGTMPPRGPSGSGVVIDAGRGFILTNDHVVAGASRVVVVLHDGRERVASQVREDPRSDLALLIIDGKGLTAAEWGDPDAADTGDWVLAVGQPFGLSGTVTAGIISGKGRGIDEVRYEDLIQTDAAVNPGNSGGPLVNLRGEVLGINVAIKTSGGGFEGIGFAVPADRARRVAADLAEYGQVRRSYLGVAIGAIDAATAERLELPGAVRVTAVRKGSPADSAGLRAGDVIVAFRDRPVRGVGSLQSAIEIAPPGRPLTLAVDRGGQRLHVDVRPSTGPPDGGPGGAPVVSEPAPPTRRPSPAPPPPLDPGPGPEPGPELLPLPPPGVEASARPGGRTSP
jgi:serine protease Do